MTTRELIRDALQEIGALSAGEAVSNGDAQVALARFNSLVDKWQIERLTIPTSERKTCDLVTSQQDYTIGPAVTDSIVVTVRPHTISKATIETVSDGDTYETPLKLLSGGEWDDVRFKVMESDYPTRARYEPTFPAGTISLWPIPSVGTSDLVIYYPNPLAKSATLDTVLSLPPGYEEALRYNLAVRLAPVFGRALPGVVSSLAVESLAQIKRANDAPETMRVDAALLGDGGAFDIWTGGL